MKPTELLSSYEQAISRALRLRLEADAAQAEADQIRQELARKMEAAGNGKTVSSPTTPKDEGRTFAPYIMEVVEAFKEPKELMDAKKLAQIRGLDIGTARNRLFRASRDHAVIRAKRGSYRLAPGIGLRVSEGK